MGAPLQYPTPERKIRFMFTDGSTVDVVAHADNSDVRAWVLAEVCKGLSAPERKDFCIVGVAYMDKAAK